MLPSLAARQQGYNSALPKTPKMTRRNITSPCKRRAPVLTLVAFGSQGSRRPQPPSVNAALWYVSFPRVAFSSPHLQLGCLMKGCEWKVMPGLSEVGNLPPPSLRLFTIPPQKRFLLPQPGSMCLGAHSSGFTLGLSCGRITIRAICLPFIAREVVYQFLRSSRAYIRRGAGLSPRAWQRNCCSTDAPCQPTDLRVPTAVDWPDASLLVSTGPPSVSTGGGPKRRDSTRTLRVCVWKW